MNKLAYEIFENMKTEEDVKETVEALVAVNSVNPVAKNDFWTHLSKIQLEAVCHLVKATYPENKQNWYEVADLLKQAIPEPGIEVNKVDKMFEDLNNSKPGHIAYIKWSEFKSIAKNVETVANAIGQALCYLTLFSNDEFWQAFNKELEEQKSFSLEATEKLSTAYKLKEGEMYS